MENLKPRDHHGPDRSIKLPAEIPDPPSDLTESERCRYMEIGAALVSAGVLSRLDRDALAQYVRLVDQAAEVGQTIAKLNGPAENPGLVRLQNSILAQVSVLQKELGLTPRSRQLMKRPKEEKKEEPTGMGKFIGRIGIAK